MNNSYCNFIGKNNCYLEMFKFVSVENIPHSIEHEREVH